MSKTSHSTDQLSMQKLWGARHRQEPSTTIMSFTAGWDLQSRLPADLRLLPYDLWSSKAHVLMLLEQRIIDLERAKPLLSALEEMELKASQGKLELDPRLEDVQTNVEHILKHTYRLPYAGDLRIGRGSLDGTVIDMHLCMRDYVLQYISFALDLIDSLSDQAKLHVQTLLPGFTGLQYATVSTWGEYLLAFAEGLTRDVQRLQDWYRLYDQSPAGIGPVFGSRFPLDRQRLAEYLGYSTHTNNTLDSSNSRWEAEFALAAAINTLQAHLSAFAETLRVLDGGSESLIDLPEEICLGGAHFPQRLNPDTLEVVQARAGTVQALTLALAGSGSKNMYGYDRSGQWTKYHILQIIDESLPSLNVFNLFIEDIEINEEVAERKLSSGFLNTPDLLEYLAERLPLSYDRTKTLLETAIRQAEAEGESTLTYEQLLATAQQENVDLELTEEAFARVSDPLSAIQDRQIDGLPLFEALTQQAGQLHKNAQKQRKWLTERIAHLIQTKQSLDGKIADLIQ